MAETVKTDKNIFSPELVNDLLSKVAGHSSLAKLSKREPLPFSGKTLVTFSMDDEVNLVAESGKKGAGSVKLEPVTMVPIKVEYGFRTSDEFLYASEEKKIEVLKAFNDGFAKKLARGIDIMAIHGVNPRDKQVSALIGEKCLIKTTNSVNTTVGQEDTDIENAIALFDTMESVDVNGIAMSKAYRTSLAKLAEKNGNRKFPELGWGNEASSLRGVAIDVNSTVSYATDNKLLAIVGDFQNYFKYGIAKEVLMDVIEYGDPDNTGRDLKGYNEVFIRSEAYIGWAILDKNAFAKIVTAE